jgi:hypothetical protein
MCTLFFKVVGLFEETLVKELYPLIFRDETVPLHYLVLEVWKWMRFILLDYQRQPQPKLRDFHSTRININALERMRYTVEFKSEYRFTTSVMYCECLPCLYELVEHPERESTRTNRRVTYLDIGKRLI